MYREGLARFSTSKYVKPHKKNLSSVTMHLTNYAINKKSKDFIFNTNEDEDNVGHKRSFSYILKVFEIFLSVSLRAGPRYSFIVDQN